jgi:two-component system sensor histidine kinase PilS (NtrC family)
VKAQRTEIIAEIERRRTALNLGLLRIYNYYRAVVGVALLLVFSQPYFVSRLGSLDESWFLWTAVAYTVVNLLSGILIQLLPDKWSDRHSLGFGIVLADIVALVTMMYFSGGIASGVAALVLISVATGAIILTGRIATLVAASASIAVLYEEFYLAIATASAGYDFFQAGIFGAIYFATSLSIQRLSRRIREKDIRALTQAAELADLERLNRQIIQRMRTGIIVVDEAGGVRMYNQSARALVGMRADSEFAQLPEPLSNALTTWRADTDYRQPPFRVGEQTPEIRVNFSAVRAADPDGDVTIYLEDTAEVQQQAQQLKLAELGRLSASIAHEVRNPLGAISHAAQLLKESDNPNPSDQRLMDIIVSHCKRMNGVIENVLELSRRRGPTPQRVVLLEHLQTFKDQSNEAFPGADIEIDVAPPETVVRIDSAQFNQALTNLVDNALRYSRDNGRGPHCLLQGGLDEGSERPYLNVIDFGTGVDPEQLQDLFTPFTTTADKGTGLGLYITKELCEANQSQLSYFQHDGGGSCFRILFAHPDRITA